MSFIVKMITFLFLLQACGVGELLRGINCFLGKKRVKGEELMMLKLMMLKLICQILHLKG